MEKIKKENKKKIIEFIKKAGDEKNYETSWNEEGVPYKFKKKSEIKKGRTSRARGARFELKVRRDLESKGRIVDKWSNNVEFEKDLDNKIIFSTGKLIIAKRKYNPFSRVMTVGTGFPDFISIGYIHDGAYSVIGIEVKINGTLSKEEKEKCVWYLKNKIFSEIWIAKAKKNGRKIEIEYVNFRERYKTFFN